MRSPHPIIWSIRSSLSRGLINPCLKAGAASSAFVNRQAVSARCNVKKAFSIVIVAIGTNVVGWLCSPLIFLHRVNVDSRYKPFQFIAGLVFAPLFKLNHFFFRDLVFRLGDLECRLKGYKLAEQFCFCLNPFRWVRYILQCGNSAGYGIERSGSAGKRIYHEYPLPKHRDRVRREWENMRAAASGVES